MRHHILVFLWSYTVFCNLFLLFLRHLCSVTGQRRNLRASVTFFCSALPSLCWFSQKLQGEQKCKTLGTRSCGVQKNYAYSGSCSSSQKISSNRINTIERETTKTMITIKLTTIETIKTIVCFIQSRQLFYQVLRYPLFTLLFFLFFFLSLFILFCSPFFTFKLRENKNCVYFGQIETLYQNRKITLNLQ